MEFYDFPFSWECHNPNWLYHIFQRGGLKPPTRLYGAFPKMWLPLNHLVVMDDHDLRIPPWLKTPPYVPCRVSMALSETGVPLNSMVLQSVSPWKKQQLEGYPLVNIQKTMENHHFFMGKTHYKWPFSIAMQTFTRGYSKNPRLPWPTEAHRDGLRASRAGPRGDDCQGRALPQDEGSRGFHGEFGVPPWLRKAPLITGIFWEKVSLLNGNIAEHQVNHGTKVTQRAKISVSHSAINDRRVDEISFFFLNEWTLGSNQEYIRMYRNFFWKFAHGSWDFTFRNIGRNNPENQWEQNVKHRSWGCHL